MTSLPPAITWFKPIAALAWKRRIGTAKRRRHSASLDHRSRPVDLHPHPQGVPRGTSVHLGTS